MGDISRYILVDAEGTIDDSDHPNAESARGAQRRADRPKAIAEEVYTYSETRLVDMPEGYDEWPPTEAAQDASGLCWLRTESVTASEK